MIKSYRQRLSPALAAICGAVLLFVAFGPDRTVAQGQPDDSNGTHSGSAPDQNPDFKSASTPGELDQSRASGETTIHGGFLLMTAYFIFLAMLFGFGYRVTQKLEKLDREYERLRNRLDDALADANLEPESEG